MLEKFDVANYKSIKKLEIQLRPFMVLVGPNGAGKTNIVQALRLFGDILSRGTTAPARQLGWSQIVHREKKPARGGLKLAGHFRMQSRNAHPATVRPDRTSVTVDAFASLTLRGSAASHEIAVVSEEFRLGDPDHGIRISRSDEGLEIHTGNDPRLWSEFSQFSGYLRSYPKEATEKEKIRVMSPPDPQTLAVLNRFILGRFFAQLEDMSSTTRLRLDASALRSDARFELVTSDGIGPTGEGLPVAVDELRGRGADPDDKFIPILTALREVYPRIEDVVPEAFGQGRVTLAFRERGISEPIPLDGVSDGVLHALALLIALRRPGIGILAVEEPENALHPWSVRKILERAQTGARQRVMITTHSETVVNAVVDPGALLIVESNEDHGTTVVPATTKEAALKAILRESGQKLGDIWLDGTLGGVPS